MSDADHAGSEVTPNYRTLDEPTKLLGLSIGQWGAVVLAAGFAYLLLLASPFPWRLNVSLIVIFGGGPMVLLLLREQGALSALELVARGASLALSGRRSLLAVPARRSARARRRRARRGPGRDRTRRDRRRASLARARGGTVSEPDAGVELAAERRRVGDLARMLPLAALEPDGLAITSDGTYVRVIEADHVLQPWRGNVEHRERLRERLRQLITRIPDRQSLQFIVEAEPLDPRRALTQDWLEIRAAMAAERREGAEQPAIEAMENFGYGLEQTVRRSAAAINAVRMRWWVVVPYRHRPAAIELPRLRRRAAPCSPCASTRRRRTSPRGSPPTSSATCAAWNAGRASSTAPSTWRCSGAGSIPARRAIPQSYSSASPGCS